MRRYRGLDHGREAHDGVAASGLESGPAAIRKRRIGRTRRRGVMVFRQQQARRVHVRAGDVGMDVDGAGHDDLADRIVGRVGAPAWGRIDDAAVAHPDVADAVAIVGRIDDAAAGDADQHRSAPPPGNAAAMRAIASATEMASLGCVAATAARLPVNGRCSTAS